MSAAVESCGGGWRLAKARRRPTGVFVSGMAVGGGSCSDRAGYAQQSPALKRVVCKYGDVVRSRDSGCPTANHRSAETGQQAPAAAATNNNNNNNSRTKVAAATRIERGVRRETEREREGGVSQKKKSRKSRSPCVKLDHWCSDARPEQTFFFFFFCPVHRCCYPPPNPLRSFGQPLGLREWTGTRATFNCSCLKQTFFLQPPKPNSVVMATTAEVSSTFSHYFIFECKSFFKKCWRNRRHFQIMKRQECQVQKRDDSLAGLERGFSRKAAITWRLESHGALWSSVNNSLGDNTFHSEPTSTDDTQRSRRAFIF